MPCPKMRCAKTDDTFADRAGKKTPPALLSGPMGGGWSRSRSPSISGEYLLRAVRLQSHPKVVWIV